ncbi:MAG TPA: glycosyltransferase family 4 protein [Baekduia sp.]
MRAPRYDIAFYAPWAGPTLAAGHRPTGGAEVQMLHLARGLAGRGLRVALLTYETPGLPSQVDGVDVLTQWHPRWKFAPARRVATLGATVWRLARTDAGTIVQRSAGAMTGIVGTVARIRRRRFVYSSASTIDFTFEETGQRRSAVALYTLGVRLAHRIVVQTDEQAALCTGRFGRRSVVIRSVAQPAADGVAGAGADGFLWIGRLATYKNPQALLDLAAAVPEAPFTIVCVPSPDDPPATAAAVAAAGARLDNLQVLGPQPRPAMLARIARATAIVSTSDFEGMPNTLLEGWSHGLPALTLNHDPDGVIARHGLGHCANGSPTALAEHARQLWAGRETDHALRDACRAYVRREHAPEQVVGRWIEVLGLG